MDKIFNPKFAFTIIAYICCILTSSEVNHVAHMFDMLISTIILRKLWLFCLEFFKDRSFSFVYTFQFFLELRLYCTNPSICRGATLIKIALPAVPGYDVFIIILRVGYPWKGWYLNEYCRTTQWVIECFLSIHLLNITQFLLCLTNCAMLCTSHDRCHEFHQFRWESKA